MMAGVNLVHVEYRGGAPAATDLVAGHLQVIFATVVEKSIPSTSRPTSCAPWR